MVTYIVLANSTRDPSVEFIDTCINNALKYTTLTTIIIKAPRCAVKISAVTF